MPSFSGLPWYGQIVLLIVVAVIAVFIFREVILPLLKLVT